MTQDAAPSQVCGTCTCCGEPESPIDLELPGRTYYFCIDCADVMGWELMLASRAEQRTIHVSELNASKGVTG